MNYFIRDLIAVDSSYTLEITIGVIIGILIILSILILTIIKYLKDK